MCVFVVCDEMVIVCVDGIDEDEIGEIELGFSVWFYFG